MTAVPGRDHSRDRWPGRTTPGSAGDPGPPGDPDDGRPLANLVYRSKTFVGARPFLAVPITRLRRPDHALRGDTDAVIEGYPKSANGFVTHAFRWAQDPPVNVAHTTHAVGLVIGGVPPRAPGAGAAARCTRGRQPDRARPPAISLELLLKGWIAFYRPLLPWRSRFALGRFEDVTTDLGAVIRRMNERLGSDFTPFEHTPENERLAFQALERDWATRIDPHEPAHEMHSGRPSAQRDRLTAEDPGQARRAEVPKPAGRSIGSLREITGD